MSEKFDFKNYQWRKMAKNGEKWRKMAMANLPFSFVKFAISPLAPPPLRCTSSFSLRRSEGEMPTSCSQGRADQSKQGIRDTNLNSHVYVTSYLILSARGKLEVVKLGWR